MNNNNIKHFVISKQAQIKRNALKQPKLHKTNQQRLANSDSDSIFTFTFKSNMCGICVFALFASFALELIGCGIHIGHSIHNGRKILQNGPKNSLMNEQ